MDGLDADDVVVCNGIDATTGDYALGPMSVASVATLARQYPATPIEGPTTRGPFDSALFETASNLSQVGWGVIFAQGAPAELRQALEPLLTLRHAQAEGLYRELTFDTARDDLRTWLARHDVSVGVLDCEIVPFYLMIVGSPSDIPYDFQYLLDLTYAVGRLAFDRIDEYRAYAQSVVAYERECSPLAAREVVYWAPRHVGDPATRLSTEMLVAPLVERTSIPADAAAQPFRAVPHVGADATKASLLGALHRGPGTLPPALVFTASHGVAWPSGHQQQRELHGALLAQDWLARSPVKPTDVVAAADIGPDARLWGTMVFAFACFGAGTPALDSFTTGGAERPRSIAERSFVAALPQRLLAHPAGGALAFIGHVDRAWGFSIRSAGKSQIQPFRSCIELLQRGFPAGFATSNFSARFAALSATLLSYRASTARDKISDRELARAWLEQTDAQSYVVLGDPAARLRPELLT